MIFSLPAISHQEFPTTAKLISGIPVLSDESLARTAAIGPLLTAHDAKCSRRDRRLKTNHDLLVFFDKLNDQQQCPLRIVLVAAA